MTTLTRAELARAVGDDPKILRAFEQQQQTVQDIASNTADNVAATAALQDATAVTLSSNDTLNNERILAVGTGLALDDQGPGQQVVIRLQNVPLTQGGYPLTMNLLADSDVDMPTSGRLLSDQDFAGGPYADDAAAGADGVPINGFYRKTGGTVAWRQT